MTDIAGVRQDMERAAIGDEDRALNQANWMSGSDATRREAIAETAKICQSRHPSGTYRADTHKI